MCRVHRKRVDVLAHVADLSGFNCPYLYPMGDGTLSRGLDTHVEVSQNDDLLIDIFPQVWDPGLVSWFMQDATPVRRRWSASPMSLYHKLRRESHVGKYFRDVRIVVAVAVPGPTRTRIQNLSVAADFLEA